MDTRNFSLKNTFYFRWFIKLIFCSFAKKSLLKIADFEEKKPFLMKNDKNETEKLMDVRKKSLSPNKKSNAEPALKVRDNPLE